MPLGHEKLHPAEATVAGKQKQLQLENVAIGMHCNLRPSDAAAVVIRFNYDANAKFEVARSTHPLPSCSIFTADTLRCDLDLSPCDIDL